MAGVSGANTVSASYGAAQTNVALVAAPPTGSSIVVQWALLSNGGTIGELKLLNGAVFSAAITASSQANPTIITCGVYVPTGTQVTISGESTATPALNGTYVATNVDGTRFSIPVNVTVAGTNGTAANAAGTGATVLDMLLPVNGSAANAKSKRVPSVLAPATPLCFTSTSVTTHRVNVGYTVERS